MGSPATPICSGAACGEPWNIRRALRSRRGKAPGGADGPAGGHRAENSPGTPGGGQPAPPESGCPAIQLRLASYAAAAPRAAAICQEASCAYLRGFAAPSCGGLLTDLFTARGWEPGVSVELSPEPPGISDGAALAAALLLPETGDGRTRCIDNPGGFR